jgi:hypothetical protein
VLYHGTTAHGGERVRKDDGSAAAGRPDPLTYYYTGGPYSQAVGAVRARDGGHIPRVALVGLGMGAMSCMAAPGEAWTFYEIDPLSVAIAHDRRLFRSVAQCAPAAPSVVGDGRLVLKQGGAPIDLLVLDMFNSDSVPTHMLTREAFALYKTRLAADGVIAINISNKHLSLAHVIAAAAEANGMVAAVKRDGPTDWRATLHMQAEIAVVAKTRAQLDALHLGAGWHVVHPGDTAVWTDDYSAILAALLAKMDE